MEKFLWMVQQEGSDPAKDEEYKKWLDKVHIPPLLNVPGIVRATMYVNTGPMLDALNLVQDLGEDPSLRAPRTGWSKGQAKYLAIYEIETEDIKETWKVIRQWIVEKYQQDKGWRHTLQKVVSRSVWQQATPPKERRPGG